MREVLHQGLDRRKHLDKRFRRLPELGRLTLLAWGSNQYGQLGRLRTTLTGPAPSPPAAEEEWAEPRVTYLDLDTAPEKAVEVQQVAAGGGHSAVVLKNGHLFLWGSEAEGQTGTFSGDGHREGEAPIPFLRPFPRRVAQVALGFAHTVILEAETGKVFGLGMNSEGEASGKREEEAQCCREEGGAPVLALGDKLAVSVAAGVKHSAAITSEGE